MRQPHPKTTEKLLLGTLARGATMQRYVFNMAIWVPNRTMEFHLVNDRYDVSDGLKVSEHKRRAKDSIGGINNIYVKADEFLSA